MALCTVTFAFPKRIVSAETIWGNTVFKFKALIGFFGHTGPAGPSPFLSADLFSLIFEPMSWKIHNRYCHTAEVRNLHYLWTFSQVLWLQHSIWGKWVFVFLATCIFTRFFFNTYMRKCRSLKLRRLTWKTWHCERLILIIFNQPKIATMPF